ncbi:hypothetical protein C1N61_27555 (plasmid) [Priestia aryabhattai]
MSDLASKLAKLPKDKKAAMIAMLKGSGAASKKKNELVPRKIGDKVPASYQQEQLWFIDSLAAGDNQNNVSALITLTGELNVGKLEESLNTIIKRHESLRTHFIDEEGVVKQVVKQWTFHELETINLLQDDLDLEEILKKNSSMPFNLEEGPLFRVLLIKASEEKHYLLWVAHHIIWDAWSYTVFMNELTTSYNNENQLEDINIQYPDFSLWQRGHLAGDRLDELNKFWKEKMSNTEVTELMTDFPRPKELNLEGHRFKRALSGDILDNVKDLAKQAGTTQYMTLLAAFKVLLHKYTQQDEIVVGTPSANRTNSQVEKLIGFFVNMIPIKTNISGGVTFRDTLSTVKESVLESFNNQDLPFEKIVAAANPKRDPSRHPLFQIEFTSESMVSDSLPKMKNLKLEHETLHDSGSRFDMSFITYESNGELVVVVEYNRNLFKEETIKQLVNNYESTLLNLSNNPDVSINQLSLLNSDSLEKVTSIWAHGKSTGTVNKSLVEVFEETVLKYPSSIAVSFKGKTLTYQELNNKVNKLARYLQVKGVKEETFVGICLNRSVDMIVSLLAVLKTGGTYIPIDSGYPQDRIDHILSDSQVKVAITEEGLVSKVGEGVTSTILVDRDNQEIEQESISNLALNIKPTNLAYILYTSGSTGKPKGVMIEHLSVVNFIKSISEDYKIKDSDTIVQFALLGFDVSVFEIFSALLNGAKLSIADNNERVSPEDLTKLIKTEQVTVAELPPALLPLLNPDELTTLRLVSVGGEAPSGMLVEQWANKNRKLFNGYGPTETTVAVTLMDCQGKYLKTPPIGKPMANHSAFILDEHLNPVSQGVPGELHIGGIGLARGYLNRCELTAEKFIKSPFECVVGDRLYKTGDLVRWLPDGNIEFLGRIDRQVKIRGFRIELEEIENVLKSYSNVTNAVVIDIDHEEFGRRLVAYITTKDSEISQKELLEFTKSKLPYYMIPFQFIKVESIPLNPNGKIDRNKLPQPNYEEIGQKESIKKPIDEVEEEIAFNIFNNVLGIKVVSVDESFFDLGGNSLQATQIVSKIRKTFNIEITLAEFFNNTTVEKLAEIVRERQKESNNEQQRLLDTLNSIESLTDDEVMKKIKEMQDKVRV